MSKILKDIKSKLSKYKISSFSVSNDIIYIQVESKFIYQIIKLLQNDKLLSFKVLTDISAVDYPASEKRFEMIYNLLSLKNNSRVIIKAKIDQEEAVDSISDIYLGAVWYEREVWDMFGIVFNNLPDHRRILTDYGFEGHPLRKDFPVTGFKEVTYDIEQKKVVYQPVKLQQDFRVFDSLSPWEGTNYVLPGDEKAKN
jgi:NADH-quinone oxidoreductase subunit C